MKCAHQPFMLNSEASSLLINLCADCAGVMDEPNCMWKSEDLDHAVLLVGYGTCPKTGKDYWLIKNSWSTYWGDQVTLTAGLLSSVANQSHGKATQDSRVRSADPNEKLVGAGVCQNSSGSSWLRHHHRPSVCSLQVETFMPKRTASS